MNMPKYLMGGNEEQGRLFWLVPTDGTRDNGHTLKQVKFCLKTRKHFFDSKSGQVLEQASQRGCEASTCADIQTPMGHSPRHPALSDPASAGGLD